MPHTTVDLSSPIAGCRCLGWVVLLLLTGHGRVAGSEIAAARLFPPAATVGQTSSVNVEGKLQQWPLQAWCDRPDVEIVAAPERGQLSVTVAPDALPGVAWLRLHTPGAASPLLPLLIEPHEVIVEREPNSDISEATEARLPAALVGKLAKSNEVDCFRVSVAAGETLVAAVTSDRVLDSAMDAVLQLVDLDGNVLAQCDDDRGLDPLLVHQVEQDRQLILRLFAFPKEPNRTIGFSGGDRYVYRIMATTGPWIDYALPLLVSPPTAQADQLPPGSRLFGWNLESDLAAKLSPATSVSPPIAGAGGLPGWQLLAVAPQLADANWIDADAFPTDAVIESDSTPPLAVYGHLQAADHAPRVRLVVQPGTKYRAAVRARASGLPLDPVLAVIDPQTGRQLARNDDASREDRDSQVEFTAPGDPDDTELGRIEIELSDLVGNHGYGHAYTLAITTIEPSLELSVETDRFFVPPGESVEIPVKVTRRDGFDRQLEIRALGLPDFITASPATSKAKGDSSKQVSLSLQVDSPEGDPSEHQGTFQIVASQVNGSDGDRQQGATPIATAGFSLLDDFQSTSLWWSVTAP